MPNPASSDFEFSHRTRQQSWQQLKASQEILNVLIIGGGIVGAGMAREFVIHGVKDVFLVEKNDFSSGTSSASSKLIHAGIRYLELVWIKLKKGDISGAITNLKFVIEASKERKVLGFLAPHLVKPKPIYMVIGKGDPRSPWAAGLGTWLYYFIQVLQGQFFSPPSFYVRKTSIQNRFPALNVNKVKAVFSFWDSETDDSRLVLDTLRSASIDGAYCLNYVEVVFYKKEGDVFSVSLRNNETNEIIFVKAKILINAGGPFVDEIRKLNKNNKVPVSNLVDRVEGCHIDVFPKITEESYYVSAGDGRLIFVLKRNEDGFEYSRVGTTERVLSEGESSDGIHATQKEIEYLLSSVREMFPQVDFDSRRKKNDAGIRPLRRQDESNPFEKNREHDIIEEEGLFHVIGVKLTDFRRVAHELFKKIDWEKWGINITRITSNISQEKPINPFQSTISYPEKNMNDFIEKTMILHWDDYLRRRKGAKPLLEWGNETKLKEDFHILKTEMGWNEEDEKKEESRARGK
ncbi:MAG: FAD-dependent oxidoreductase [Elusimicrobiota bacterium]